MKEKIALVLAAGCVGLLVYLAFFVGDQNPIRVVTVPFAPLVQPAIDTVGVTTSSVPAKAMPRELKELVGSAPVPKPAGVAPVVNDVLALNSEEMAVLDGVNAIREAESLSELVDVSELNEAAQLHAEDMATKGYFAHNSPQGIQYTEWAQIAGYRYSYYGENLAEGFTSGDDIVTAWENSPDHFANIVNANYTETGLGEATGTYEGQVTEFVVEVFGSPN